MPGKKFKEPNSKAVAAKERKAAVRRDEEERKRKEEEDEYWRDDDKHAARKQDRKADREKRRQDQLDKKQEAKKLLEAEEQTIKGKSSSSSRPPQKVTQAQIAESQATGGATPLPKSVIEVDPLVENPNHLLRQRTLEGHHDAVTVEEAIAVLKVSDGGGGDSLDRHPERRMKASYAVFEEREIPRLKAENPNLRLSQVKQLVRKEWMKSPENPMNQPHATFNEKS